MNKKLIESYFDRQLSRNARIYYGTEGQLIRNEENTSKGKVKYSEKDWEALYRTNCSVALLF